MIQSRQGAQFRAGPGQTLKQPCLSHALAMSQASASRGITLCAGPREGQQKFGTVLAAVRGRSQKWSHVQNRFGIPPKVLWNLTQKFFGGSPPQNWHTPQLPVCFPSFLAKQMRIESSIERVIRTSHQQYIIPTYMYIHIHIYICTHAYTVFLSRRYRHVDTRIACVYIYIYTHIYTVFFIYIYKTL